MIIILEINGEQVWVRLHRKGTVFEWSALRPFTRTQALSSLCEKLLVSRLPENTAMIGQLRNFCHIIKLLTTFSKQTHYYRTKTQFVWEPSYFKMSAAPFTVEMIFVFLLTLCLLHQYGNWRKQHWLVTTAVFISWYFSFLIVFILPLDVSGVSLSIFLENKDYLCDIFSKRGPVNPVMKRQTLLVLF